MSGPSNGTLTGTGASRVYTPNLNYYGSDSFTYKVNDGQVDSNVSTVSITVNPVNDAPVSQPLVVTVAEDGQVTVNLVASDIENDTLTYSIVSGPSNGTLTGTGASRVYTPNLNYYGSDSFTYKVNDGQVDSNVSTVSITVNSVNDAPVSQSVAVTVAEDGQVTVNLVASDIENDTLTYSIVSGPSNGTLTGTGASRVYTPNLNYYGSDSFTYKVQ